MTPRKPESAKKYLAWLIHPVTVGLVITAIMVKLTFNYYAIAGRAPDGNQEVGITNLLYIAHQKSVDFRLRARGPRKISPNIALLAVDERSVETIGRWPWSRDIIAKAMDKAFEYNAKLVAFDITFSEPQLNPVAQVSNQFRATGTLTPQLEQLLNENSEKLNFDRILKESFTRHADKIVAGSLFNSVISTKAYDPSTTFCRDMIFKLSPVAKQWDKEEILLSVIDPYQPYIPTALTELFQAILVEKEAAIRERLGAPRNRRQALDINSKVQSDLHETCNTILTENRALFNEHWQEGILSQENPKEFTFATYDAWLEDFKAHSIENSVLYADDWVLNTPEISEGTKHTAYFNTEQDSDGTIRSKALVVRTGNSYFPSLSLKSFLVANNFNASPKLEYNPASFSKEVAGIEVTNNETGDPIFTIPTDHEGKMMINYAGPDRMYPYLSFADLLSDSPDAEVEQRVWHPEVKRWEIQKFKVKKAEFIKDKIFIAGATATGIYDLRVTPFQENFPGTETHLNALDNIVQKNFFKTAGNEKVYMPIALTVIGVLLSVALSFVGAIMGLALTGGALITAILFDKYYLFSHGTVIAIIWPLFLICSLYVCLTFYRYLTEERNKKELRQTFQKYVSPAIVEEILAHPDNIELGGRKAHLTVSFSDVRGFTTISEKLDPRELSDLLNSYLTPMTELVFSNKGTLDKYMGDAIMAFFGAPIAYNDNAKWACRCALQSLQKLAELQAEYKRKGLPNIDIGIGLNTGEVNVGNMGSETVRSYTVMGDAVNLASRLEGINKTYGTRIILSEFTYAEIKDDFVCREVDMVRVKGKALPVRIFELIAEGKVAQPVEQMIQYFNEGYAHYHKMEWQQAIDSFGKALQIKADDEVSKLYVERCQEFIAEPPGQSWDGVYIMKSK